MYNSLVEYSYRKITLLKNDRQHLVKIRMFVPVHLTWVETVVMEKKFYQAEMDEMVVMECLFLKVLLAQMVRLDPLDHKEFLGHLCEVGSNHLPRSLSLSVTSSVKRASGLLSSTTLAACLRGRFAVVSVCRPCLRHRLPRLSSP